MRQRYANSDSKLEKRKKRRKSSNEKINVIRGKIKFYSKLTLFIASLAGLASKK